MAARICLHVCFFLSGAVALVYQLVWQRQLTLVLGVSTMSIAAVLSAFLAGLALGAWAAGPRVDRSPDVVRLYALIELGIAALGLLSGFLVDPIMRVYAAVYHAVEPGWLLSNLIRFGISFIAFGVPSLLMGATVPAMARLTAQWLGTVEAGFGRFYAVNTLGAVAGAALAGFLLLRTLGSQSTLLIAAAGNVCIAGLALSVRRSRQVAHPRDRAETLPASGAAAHQAFALIAAAAAGAIALAYEVAWMRLVSVYTLNSVYVYGMVVTAYLAALAIGSAFAEWIVRRRPGWIIPTIAATQFALALLTPLALGFLPAFADIGIDDRTLTDSQIFVREYLLATAIVLLPTVLLGMTLPLLVALYRSPVARAGGSVGRIYAWNALGTITGSAVTGVLLVPLVGLRGTLLLLATGNLLIGATAATLEKPETRRRRIAPTAAACVFAVVIVLLPAPIRFYRTMRPNLDEQVVYYAEGPSATVHVTRVAAVAEPYLQLYVDSQGVAGTYPEIVIDQKMTGHLTVLLHPAARRTLTVGFGTGGSSYSALQHGIKVEVVEIEPRVPDAWRLFESENRGLVGPHTLTANFRLILDDARSWLNVTQTQYDSIMTDMTSIQYRGNGNLYTRDFFALMRSRLAPGGFGCAWVPIEGVRPAQLKVVVRTFQSVFPHTSIWYMLNLPTDFVFLVGTPQPLALDLPEVAARMSRPLAAQDLATIRIAHPYHLLACLLLAEEDAAAYAGDGPLHTDDLPLLDYLTHASRYQPTAAVNLTELVSHRRDPGGYVRTWLPPASSADPAAPDWTTWDQAARLLLAGHIAVFGGDAEGLAAAHAAYREALQLLPADRLIQHLAARGGPPSRVSQPPDPAAPVAAPAPMPQPPDTPAL